MSLRTTSTLIPETVSVLVSDDEFADVVLDGLRHRLLILADVLRQRVHCIGTALNDQLD